MLETEVAQLTSLVLWSAFGLALLFGAIVQRTHFCTMGAVADIVNMGDWTRMRMWVLAMAVAVLGFNALVALGWVQAADTLYAGPRLLWLSNLLGGALFGFGMMLASGCGSKTLVRIGGGSLKAVVVFCVLGLAAFATLRGATSVLRDSTVDRVLLQLPAGQDLPSLLVHFSGGALSGPQAAGGLGLALGLLLLAFALKSAEGRSANNLLGGIGLGLLVLALWWVTGRLGHLDEHPLTLEETFLATGSRRMESFSFVAPIAQTLDWVLFFSDKLKLLSVGIVSTVGVILGAALVAVAQRQFRWEGFAGTADTAHHLVGAVLMGVGGVMALGCTVGQGLSGISTLSLGSFIAVAGILGGAWLGLRWQIWWLERTA